MDFSFREKHITGPVEAFFYVALWSLDFDETVNYLINGISVTIAGSGCRYYNPEDLDPWDDQVPYEGVKFTLDDFPEGEEVIVSRQEIYALLEEACKFYVERENSSGKSVELLAWVKNKVSSQQERSAPCEVE